MSPRYVVAAGAMGLVWWGVLLLPPQTAAFLKGFGWIAGAALVVASVATALLLRPLVVAERGQWRSIALGPLLGAFLFSELLATGTWIGEGFHSINYVDLFLLIPYWVLLGTCWHFWIVGPVSWLAHRVMRRAALGDGTGGGWVVHAPSRQD